MSEYRKSFTFQYEIADFSSQTPSLSLERPAKTCDNPLADYFSINYIFLNEKIIKIKPI
jgi:hypothetical protein